MSWPPTLGELPSGLSPAELRRRAKEAIAGARTELDRLVIAGAVPTVGSFLEPLDRLLTPVLDVSSHGALMFSVHPDAETRAAGREVSEAADQFFNEFRLRTDVYALLRRLDLRAEDGPTRFAVSKMVRDMRRAGVEKDPATRVRLLDMSNAIDRVSNQFSENVAKMDREILVPGGDALAGLPPDFIAAHRAGPDGNIRITTKYPDALPVLSYCEDAEVRRRMLREFLNRAYPDNLPILDELLTRRGEFARTLEYSSYAAYAIEDKMMETPQAARALLERLESLLRAPANADLARYLERKRRDLPEAPRLEPWDSELFGGGFYDNRIRTEEFGVDPRVLRAYLPYLQVRDGLLTLCRELFGVAFERIPTAEVWHPTVEAYDVTQGTRRLGRCYLDLIPRDGKFSHAACFAVREGVAGFQYPQSALVCNFIDASVPVEAARMEWRDVVTFFHEFGHLLHALLSGQPRWMYNSHSHVEWDFIEAPSQLFEEWARDPATLARFARDPATGEGIPDELLQKLRGADSLGRPSRLLRQVALSAVSLEFYDRDPTGLDTSAAFREAWDRFYPFALPDEYHPQAAFGHLTGYSAFYYTYLWSIVIARDLLSPFHDRGTLTDPSIAARYASEILAPGSSVPAAQLIRNYLGRDFTFDAFERWVRGPTATGPRTS